MTTPRGERLLVADLRATAPAWALPDWAPAALAAMAPAGWRLHFVSAPTISDGDGADRASDEAVAAVADAEAYAGFGLPRTLLAAAPGLRWVHSAAAGVGSLLHPELRERGIVLTNSAGVHARPIAEWVLGAVLHFLRGFDVAERLRARAAWDREPFVGAGHTARELGECRALVVGAGGIGSAVAEALAAHGVRCTGMRRRPELGAPPGFAAVIGPDGLDAALAEADVLVLSAPLTGDTRALMTAERLARLPAGAILVNVGRGQLVDEDALVAALQAGRLRGAALDVVAQEPLPAESPLWTLDRVLITPHVSGVSPRRFWERQLALLGENWRRWAAGEPLRNEVDQRAGY